MARLIDSSLWIDFSRRKSPAALKSFIHPFLLDPAAVLCEPIAYEVLRLASPSELPDLQEQFDSLPLLPTPIGLWKGATSLGQNCRELGINAGSMDLLIAALALHYDAEIVTFDADYLAIARIAPLRVTHLFRVDP